ncbi:hypothetical protein G4357_08435 [Dorea longicatena]|uniref:hypothetical protein n=1 Tax=Dorea TaxID=189330 RepID=UPI00156F5CA3|nr:MULTISPECIES: hypothetical protein [Dorea]MCM1894356.1 hypothetical protein [Dorea sp. MB18-49]NSE44348.1 hypothetical protein [Dorea longicatena]
MRRFIRYLYEYEQEKKMRNVGFVKVEQDVDQCVIHVHGKGFRMEENAQGLRVYLFWNTEDKCIGIPQGVTEVPGPAVNWQLCYTPEDVGKKENYDFVNGIILKDVNGHWYAAVWNDDVVNVCRMEMWKMEEDSVQGEETECKKGLAQDEEPECKKETLQDEESESGKLEDDLEKEACLGGKVRKIQRKDMVCLPRCEWRHANNSFLIHGYYNYHHLILTVRDDRLKLGVPGVYHPQEEKAAESFGFPEFIPAEELDLKLTDEEKNDREKFGYWCRDIRGSHDCVEPQKR